MTSTLDMLALTADRLRSSVLRRVMRFAWARRLFKTRHERLLLFYLASLVINIPLALYVPVLVLVLGPIVYGVPHLFASLRYVHHGLADSAQAKDAELGKRSLRILGTIFAAVAGFRIATDYAGWFPVDVQFALLPEAVSAGVTVIACLALYRGRITALLRALVVVVPLFMATWYRPLATFGVLTLLHNFVAFAYWLTSAKTRADLHVAAFAAVVFTAVSACMLLGAFDAVYGISQPTFTVPWAQLDYEELGRLVAPWTRNRTVWFHCVSAYAFGQTMHYFVWLKAVPEQHLRQTVPVPFRESLRLLRRDFGRKQAAVAAAVCLAALAVFAFFTMPEARVLYFATASYHGFLEMAALGLVRTKLT